MPQITLPSLEAVVTLNPCQVPPPDPVVTTTAPVREHQLLYLSTGDRLYAVNASDGTARWCQQVKLIRTRKVSYPPGVSSPPPPRLTFGAPRVTGDVSGDKGAVYVAIDGFGAYTCAFTASDGALLWWTPTDAGVASMPFMDWAVPLVQDGIVYSGTYALNAQDGSVLWRIDIDTRAEGTLALHALTADTLYATTHRGIYATNAQDGQIRWHYPPNGQSHMSGPPVVADGLLYAGTNAFLGYPLTGYLFVLDAETGAEIWRYPIGDYIGAVAQHETIYVSSGDRTLYALDARSGLLRWQHQFAASVYYPASIANNVLYININTDGAYALSSEAGAVLWHQPLENGPGNSFTFGPSVVLDDAVYLVRLDKRARGVLYALDTRAGAECWHTAYPLGGARLAAAQ